MTDEDIRAVADHIVHSIEKIAERYSRYGSHLEFDDYILTVIATDLSWKFNRYQIEEAFEDHRIQMLLEFFVTPEDYRKTNKVH